MSSPDDRAKRRSRRHNHVAKDLRTPLYKQRIIEDKKKVPAIKDLTHADLIKLIQEDDDL